MRVFLSIIGIICSFFMLRFREQVADLIGEAEWMQKIGGVYNFVIVLSIFLFLWSIAALTGTLDLLFSPIKYILPGMRPSPSGVEAI